MEEILEILKSLNLAPGLYGTAIILAILLRFARGMVPGVGTPQTYYVALGLGAAGAVLEMAQGDAWREIVKTGLSLAAVVLVLQKVLQMAAEKLPWLPTDGQWVKPPKEGQ